jgi:predicted  nucleic acid-binding Zn-ribbon protein
MTDAKKFEAALTRFEIALDTVEKALMAKRDAETRAKAAEAQAAALMNDRQKLDRDLAQVRAKAAELVDTSKQAAGKIDSAVSRIRSVLYSNSGG